MLVKHYLYLLKQFSFFLVTFLPFMWLEMSAAYISLIDGKSLLGIIRLL